PGTAAPPSESVPPSDSVPPQTEPESTTLPNLNPQEEVEFSKPSESINKGEPKLNVKKDKKSKAANQPRTRSQTKPVTPSVTFEIKFDDKKKTNFKKRGVNISPEGINLNKADST
ncbi:unnamed protein product, partial [Rotaria magnacalcarata]